ncbi:hypothetical protein B0T24DRAFT_722801 [Lasiosphaeria ovina]|uniref:Uncharacterized protein n=1 Tax=Lasiosphaeria ovina TaxID=92902 RepID=A0AAE0JYX1_9PEZI|nr:hypothetical protein B0T24DRAFT_722801 [Lasiosphaeria ovina]
MAAAAPNGNGNGNGNSHHAAAAEDDTPPLFTLKPVPVENLRPLRVVVVGAGFAGILAAIRIPEKLRNIDLTVYEKNGGVGGVWLLNKYPGVACDIPSHSYQYSFAPNPRWSNLYAPGSEIRKYLEDVAAKFGATRFIKTAHEVEHCAWDAAAKQWKIRVKNLATGASFDDAAHVVVTARGQLNQAKWPAIPGLDKFPGKVMHSGEWDESYDFRNKKIGVVGNGSSAIQIIPSLQKVEGASLTCFMRSPTWISSAFGDQAMALLGLDPAATAFTQEQRDTLAADAAQYLQFRKVFEDGGNLIHESTILKARMQTEVEAVFRAGMASALAGNPALAAALIPNFAPGCRRLTPGRGFLEALLAENVETVFGDGIVCAGGSEGSEGGKGVVELASGRQVTNVDVLVCATGFHVSAPPSFEVVGRGGQTLAQRWAALPESYLSVAVDGFPNYLMMFGPNSAIGFGSLTKILEAEADYVVAAIRKLQKEDYAAMEPKAARVRDFSAYVAAYFRNTVYLDDCRSWYRRGGHIVGLWPGSTLHALEALRSPRWEDWVYEAARDPEDGGSDNALRWLGNGWSTAQTSGDPSWYINPDEVEIPYGSRPEENPRYKARPWSY